jgi:hypothetical protein
MRFATRVVVAPLVAVAACAVLASSPAEAERKKRKKVDSDVEDVTAIQKRLIVLTDGEGIFLIADPTWGDEHVLFFGDGKTFHRQRVFSAGADGGQGTWSMRFWSPRVSSQADVEALPAGKFRLSCGSDEVDLKKLPDAEAARIVERAAFKKALWRRQAQFLARDDHGTYYFVDRLRDELGGKGHRIFVGPKGALKEVPMTNIVSDSVGEIYATRKGELRFVTSQNAAMWMAGTGKTDLTIVPVEDNVAMIYGELGVYEGSLGTPCDEFDGRPASGNR